MQRFGPRPQRGDVGDRAEKWRAIAWMLIPAVAIVEFVPGGLTGGLPFPIRAALVLLIGYALGTALHWLSARSASRFVNTLRAAGGEPRAPEFSAQQALLMQGRVDDAIKSFHSYIAHHPEDLDARIRLADVLAREGNDLVLAEEMYLEVRIIGASRRQDVLLSNGLIDLHRRGGDREKLKAELARFARNHAGSLEARHAHDYLRRLTREDGTSAE